MIEMVNISDQFIGIRDVLAKNLKINRKKMGFTQEQLAEKADISTHHIAMIETCKTFPKPEILERMANILEIAPHELFYMPAPAETSLERLEEKVDNIENIVLAIKQAFSEERKKKR